MKQGLIVRRSILVLALGILLVGCSGINNSTPSPSGSLVPHNQLPKNITLVNISYKQIATGILATGNMKYSARRSRFSRPKGQFMIKIASHDGKALTTKQVRLHKGRMPHYSHFEFLIENALPANSRLYLSML